MSYLEATKSWLKNSEHPLAAKIVPQLKALRALNIPLPLILYRLAIPVVFLITNTLKELVRILWWTPIFKTHIKIPPKSLYLYTGMPFIAGQLDIHMGEGCRVSGQTTFSGRNQAHQIAQLIIGNNVGISWQTTIAVAGRVVIGDNVRIAGRCFLAGYPGHPLNPNARAAGAADLASQTGDIILENNVWLGTGTTVLPNVKIGQNSIIGTGSVVTKNIPANVIAAGNPAKVLRTLTQEELGLSPLFPEKNGDSSEAISHVA